ncbi:MAG: hypothetical protein M1814_001743 [Vezdaea aestivalis]|nr:MAG: hypothetical protein M1814_001743 [Vezdaea aestivalis]
MPDFEADSKVFDSSRDAADSTTLSAVKRRREETPPVEAEASAGTQDDSPFAISVDEVALISGEEVTMKALKGALPYVSDWDGEISEALQKFRKVGKA